MENQSHIIGGQARSYWDNDNFNHLKDYLDLYFLQKISDESNPNIEPDIVFYENVAFWNNMMRYKNYPGRIISLKGFSILEWLPSSPGLYYTGNAIEQRKLAQKNPEDYLKYIPENPIGSKFTELQPHRKLGMIRGGFGSVRLAPKRIHGREMFFLCASSTCVSHEGIPILVEENIYKKIIDVITADKLPIVDMIGKLKLLPDDCSLLKIDYCSSFPKFYIEVEDLTVKSTLNNSNALVSIAISYSQNENLWIGPQLSYSFCTFSPSSNDGELKDAVHWLNDYASRYSGSSTPYVIGDFDEFFNHYENVKIPLKELMRGNVTMETLMSLKELFHFEINNNVYDNVYNSTIITNSKINKSTLNN